MPEGRMSPRVLRDLPDVSEAVVAGSRPWEPCRKHRFGGGQDGKAAGAIRIRAGSPAEKVLGQNDRPAESRQYRAAQDKYTYFLLAAAGAAVGLAINQTRGFPLS